MNLTIPVIGSIPPAQAREFLKFAYDSGTSAAPLPPAGRTSISLYLASSLASEVSTHAVRRGVQPSEEAAERIYGWLHRPIQKQNASTSAGVPAPEHELDGLRKKAADYAQQTINSGKIGFLEAATGLGKSRLIAQTIVHITTTNPKAQTVVAAPTLSVLAQLIKESAFVAGFPASNKIAVLLGRNQYINESALLDGLNDLTHERATNDEGRKQAKSLIEWINNGSPVISEFGQLFATYIPNLSHLTDDARSLAPDLPINAFTMARKSKGSDEETAAEIIQEMKAAAVNAQVIFCTHAYLAAQIKLQANFNIAAVQFSHLIVDEAHLLEEAVASSMGSEYHAYAAVRWAKSYDGPNARAIREAAELIRTELFRIQTKDGHVYDAKMARKIRDLFRPIGELLKEKFAPEYYHIVRNIARDEAPLFLTFSPIRRYPAVSTGPRTVRTYLEKHLWAKVKSAILYSATIYTQGKDGAPSAHYQRVKLGIDGNRALQFPPLTYADIYNAPTLHLPNKADAPSLCYPGGDDGIESSAHHTSFNAWAKKIACHIATVAETAKGGTLVLTTSFADLRAIGIHLPEGLRLRLVDATGDHSTNRNSAEFKKTARAGLRPIWIATGAAWTGLDLRDDHAITADSDNLLTDLVIVRLPLCLVKTTTQLCRREWMKFSADIHETVIRFKQGLGRLIRRPGLQNRRIHILDGRLITLPKTHYRVYARTIAPYKNCRDLLTDDGR
jgi:Rad3-related DNA helicase